MDAAVVVDGPTRPLAVFSKTLGIGFLVIVAGIAILAQLGTQQEVGFREFGLDRFYAAGAGVLLTTNNALTICAFLVASWFRGSARRVGVLLFAYGAMVLVILGLSYVVIHDADIDCLYNLDKLGSVTTTLETYGDGTNPPSSLRNYGSWSRVLPNCGLRWSLILSTIAVVLGALCMRAERRDKT